MAGLHKLSMLNLEGCNVVTASCLESISGLLSLCCFVFSNDCVNNIDSCP